MSHASSVGGLPITRALPSPRRRMVGAWCFADHAGLADLPPDKQMKVGPHPHTGPQTFSGMIEGEILHRDSLGSVQRLRAGQVNLMTARRGVSSEESQTERSSDEIAQYALDWNGERGDFGRVEGFDGPRLVAPDPQDLRLRG